MNVYVDEYDVIWCCSSLMNYYMNVYVDEYDVVHGWWIIIWMYMLMNTMLYDVVHDWWIIIWISLIDELWYYDAKSLLLSMSLKLFIILYVVQRVWIKMINVVGNVI